MALNKEEVIAKMKERRFTVYATIGNAKVQFISDHMYNSASTLRSHIPIINVFVNLEKDEFECVYQLGGSTSRLSSTVCGSVMNDEHFDRIVSRFESEAKWLSRLAV